MKKEECSKCEGCGKIAEGDRSPWKYWEGKEGVIAISMGWEKPIECPKCKGTGTFNRKVE